MSAALDVAIGLVLMYLVLSLFCTTINEFIANLVNLRASTLRSAMEEMIDDPNLKALFYNHGMIDGTKVASSAGASKPSPASPVADAVRAPAPASGWLAKKFEATVQMIREKHPSYLSGRSVAMALIGTLGAAGTDPIPTLDKLKETVKTLPDSNIRDMLGAAIADAEGNIEKLRTSIASWFDDSMDRLSGAYKRYLKVISLAVGLAIAAILNADTLHVATVLWQDPVLRNEVTQTATDMVQQNSALLADTACKKPKGGTADDTAHQTYNLCQLHSEAMTLPIGWTQFPQGVLPWFWKVLGLWMTAVALSLGAPFWFDLLSQFVNIRGSGNKPGQTVSQPGTTSNVQVTAQMLPAPPAEAPAQG